MGKKTKGSLHVKSTPTNLTIMDFYIVSQHVETFTHSRAAVKQSPCNGAGPCTDVGGDRLSNNLRVKRALKIWTLIFLAVSQPLS